VEQAAIGYTYIIVSKVLNMGRDVSLDLTLKVKLSKDNVQKILNQGAALGCRYIDDEHWSYGLPNIFITPVDATALVMRAIDEKKKSLNPRIIIPSIRFTYQDTFCTLIFTEECNEFMVILCCISRGTYWYKEEPHIDFERYARLMLEMCHDIPILEMETDDTYFETNFARLQLAKNNPYIIMNIGIEMTLAIELDEKNLQKIFEHGAKIGFKYVGPDQEKDSSEFMSTAEAVDYIMQKIYSYKETTSTSYFPMIGFYYLNTFCVLIFAERVDLSLEIFCSIGKTSHRHKENLYSSVVDVDWDQYIKLMLDVCHGLTIMEFKTNNGPRPAQLNLQLIT